MWKANGAKGWTDAPIRASSADLQLDNFARKGQSIYSSAEAVFPVHAIRTHCIKMCSDQTCFCGKSANVTKPINCVNCCGQHSSRSHNCPVYEGKISYAQIVKFTVSPAPIMRKILPALTQFLEQYFSEVFRNWKYKKRCGLGGHANGATVSYTHLDVYKRQM